MHIERYSEGSRVFLAIHGWGGDHREFAPLAAGRPSDARLLSVDLPGYGRSPPPERWDLRAIGAELGGLLAREAGPDGGTLIGFCSGAILALLAAQARPAAARRIVMIDPFAYLPFYFRIFTWGAAGRAMYRSAFAGGAGRRVVNRVLRKRQNADADFTVAFERVNHEVTLRYLALFARLGSVAQFAGLPAKFDLIYGERTFAAVRRSIRMLRALWPEARAEALPGVGHLPMVKAARRIREIVFGG